MIVVNKSVCEHQPFKRKYIVQDTEQKRYVVLTWDEIQNAPIVYDEEFDEILSKRIWHATNYVGSGANKTQGKQIMHRTIMSIVDPEGMREEGRTVDHINGFKTDNRKENLRVASYSMQNRNRSRKGTPPKDLFESGITELPKYVLWEEGKNCFTIFGHPVLYDDVTLNKRKNPRIYGIKSTKVSHKNKYDDILQKLSVLDSRLDADEAEFRMKKQRLTSEFLNITNAILFVENKPMVQIPIDATRDIRNERRQFIRKEYSRFRNELKTVKNELETVKAERDKLVDEVSELRIKLVVAQLKGLPSLSF